MARELEAEGHGMRIATDDWQEAMGSTPTMGIFMSVSSQCCTATPCPSSTSASTSYSKTDCWTRAERREKFADARAHGADVSWHIFEVEQDELWRHLSSRNEGSVRGLHGSRADLDHIISVFEPPTTAEMATVDAVAIPH